MKRNLASRARARRLVSSSTNENRNNNKNTKNTGIDNQDLDMRGHSSKEDQQTNNKKETQNYTKNKNIHSENSNTRKQNQSKEVCSSECSIAKKLPMEAMEVNETDKTKPMTSYLEPMDILKEPLHEDRSQNMIENIPKEQNISKCTMSIEQSMETTKVNELGNTKPMSPDHKPMDVTDVMENEGNKQNGSELSKDQDMIKSNISKEQPMESMEVKETGKTNFTSPDQEPMDVTDVTCNEGNKQNKSEELSKGQEKTKCAISNEPPIETMSFKKTSEETDKNIVQSVTHEDNTKVTTSNQNDINTTDEQDKSNENYKQNMSEELVLNEKENTSASSSIEKVIELTKKNETVEELNIREERKTNSMMEKHTRNENRENMCEELPKEQDSIKATSATENPMDPANTKKIGEDSNKPSGSRKLSIGKDSTEETNSKYGDEHGEKEKSMENGSQDVIGELKIKEDHVIKPRKCQPSDERTKNSKGNKGKKNDLTRSLKTKSKDIHGSAGTSSDNILEVEETPETLDFSSGSSDNYIPNSESDSSYEQPKKKRRKQPVNVILPASTSDLSSSEEKQFQVKERKKRKSLKERREDRLARIMARNSGKCYFTKSGKFVDSRHLAPLDICRKGCKDRLPENVRTHVFNDYWTLGSYNERAKYTEKLMNVQKKKSSKTGSNEKRKYTITYTIRYFDTQYPVCKGCFLKTLGESNRFVQTVAEKVIKFGRAINSEKGHAASYRKISEERINLVKLHINKFPAYESHYSRSKTSKKYLSSELTIDSMYRLYTEENENPVSKTVYARVFKDMNLAIKKPSVDTCNKCNLLHNKLKYADPESQAARDYAQELKSHHEASDAAYDEKKKDKKMVRSDENTDTSVIAFDLQQCLPTPLLATSSAFYKRQLWVYNLTIHDFETNHAYCYMWPECTGARGANQIASCLYDFLMVRLPLLHPKAKKVIMFSDCCSGQNKNSIVTSMLMLVVNQSPQLNSIVHKFLVPGHTHMEVDGDHAIIERKKKKTSMNIHLPRDWYQLVRTSSNRDRKFSVIEMANDDFYDFADFAKKFLLVKKIDCEGNKFVWSNVRMLKYEKGRFPEFQYKESFGEDNLKVMSYAKRNKIYEQININSVKKCYSGPLPISVQKKNDLISLLDYIDPSAHDFYHNLITSEDLRDIDPDIMPDEIDKTNLD